MRACLLMIPWFVAACNAEPVEAPDAGDEGWGARCEPTPGDDPEPLAFLDFVVSGEGLGQHEGRIVRFVTYDSVAPTRVFGVAEVAIQDGAFSARWTDGYERYEYQPVSFYIDLDDDGRCDVGQDLGAHFVSSAWNPVGDAPLLEVIPDGLPRLATDAVCQDVDRCAD